jgi:hypothetical protein
MASVVSGLVLAMNMLYAAVFGGPIDGTSWDVKVRQQGFFHWTTQTDTLVFHRGKAVIAGAIAKGYAPTLYEASRDESGTAFSVHLEQEGHDPIDWSGRVKNDRIAGVMIVRGRDGRVSRYVFSGGRKAG